MLKAPLRRVTAALLPVVAVFCALPIAAASAQQAGHDQTRRDCGLNVVVVKGEVTASAASGSTTFTANVWSVRVTEIRLSDDHKYADDPAILAACASATGTSASTGTTSTGTSTSTGTTTGTTCPAHAGTSLHTGDEHSIAKGITMNTGSATKVMLDGATSTLAGLAKEDHFVAVYIVPSCAGNGSSSLIPASLVAAWSPGSHLASVATHEADRFVSREHHGDHAHHGDSKFKK